jgi:hypothetical protein
VKRLENLVIDSAFWTFRGELPAAKSPDLEQQFEGLN